MNTEYIIVGSANINERSMYLWRVIEIVKWLQVTGAYQRIGFNNIDNAADDGNVHTFRKKGQTTFYFNIFNILFMYHLSQDNTT